MRFDRTNWKALTLCFLAAAVFWIFNALNKSYSTNLQYPVQFEFDQSRFIPVEPLPRTLTINVNGIGWDLLRKRLGLKVASIQLTLERPAETHKIVAATLSPVIASQIGTLNMNYIVNDTIRLKIEPRSRRKVQIIADLENLSFKKNLGRISRVRIEPDTVWLDGPRSLLESIGDTLPVKLKGSRISSDIRENVEVTVPQNELIKRNPPVVEVSFEVGTLVERSDKIALSLPKGLFSDQDSVHITFTIPDRDLGSLDLSSLTAQVVLPVKEMKKGETRTTLPVVGPVPELFRLNQLDSVKIRKL